MPSIRPRMMRDLKGDRASWRVGEVEVDRRVVPELRRRIAWRALLDGQWIPSHEQFVSTGSPPADALPLGGDAILEQVDVGREDIVAQLLERRDVIENPDTSSVRRRDEVAVARVDDQIVHRNGRHVVHQAMPLFAAVD